MAIPGIKVTQSAIDSYKASRSLCDLHTMNRDADKIAKQSAAMVRKPIEKAEHVAVENEDAIAFAVAHGTPEKVAKNLDTIA